MTRPRLAGPTAKANLPGHPTTVSGQSTQQVTIVGSMAVVAGGILGTAVLVPFDESGLGKRQASTCPVRELQWPGGEVTTNAGPEGGPLIMRNPRHWKVKPPPR